VGGGPWVHLALALFVCATPSSLLGLVASNSSGRLLSLPQHRHVGVAAAVTAAGEPSLSATLSPVPQAAQPLSRSCRPQVLQASQPQSCHSQTGAGWWNQRLGAWVHGSHISPLCLALLSSGGHTSPVL
jgi:hypothetical protein